MRFIDQIDADRAAIRWLEGRAIALDAERIEWHNHETPGRTGSAWKGNVLLAVTVVLRDDLNWSVLVCYDVHERGMTGAGRPFDCDLSGEQGHD